MHTISDRIYAPAYTAGFQCIAGKCRHSCCIGWEIDIDDDSLQRFQNVSGELGRKLASCIALPDETSEESTAHFILDEKERCPFLTSKNLCELILTLGEDSLCDICREHPRFYNTLSDRMEMGLGLCCEEAARLLLSEKAPIRIVDISAGTNPGKKSRKSLWARAVGNKDEASSATAYEDTFLGSMDEDELELLKLRGRIFAILQDRSMSLPHRVEEIRRMLDLPDGDPDYMHWGMFLDGLERLDPAWTKEIEKLKTARDVDMSGFATQMLMQKRTTEYENTLWYLLYRHLIHALEDGYVAARVQFAILGTTLISYLGACRMAEKGEFTLDDRVELLRMFSSEIEYSDENVDRILTHILERDGRL